MIQRRGNNDVEKDEKTETQLQYRRKDVQISLMSRFS